MSNTNGMEGATPMTTTSREQIEAGELIRAYRSGQIGRTSFIQRMTAMRYDVEIVAALATSFDLAEASHDQ